MWKYLTITLLFITQINLSIGAHVRICNHGVYLAKCYLESKTIGFGFQFNRYETDLFPIFQCMIIDIPFNSVWNNLECKILTFIAIYSKIFTQELTSSLLNSCYTMRGTILNPTWSETKC